MSSNWKKWLYGLGAAFISALGTSVSTIAIDPDKFNLSSLVGLGHVFLAAIVSGVISAGAYLAKSPLPQDTTATLPGGTQVTTQSPAAVTEATTQNPRTGQTTTTTTVASPPPNQ